MLLSDIGRAGVVGALRRYAPLGAAAAVGCRAPRGLTRCGSRPLPARFPGHPSLDGQECGHPGGQWPDANHPLVDDGGWSEYSAASPSPCKRLSPFLLTPHHSSSRRSPSPVSAASAPDTPAAKAAALIDEQTAPRPAGSAERIAPTEGTAPTGAPVLLLTTSPRLATVQFMVEEVEVEDAPSSHAAPTESPPHDESAAEDTDVAEDHAVDETEERAENASLGSPAAEQAAPRVFWRIAHRRGAIREQTVEPQPQSSARPGVLNEIRAGMAFTFGQPLMRTGGYNLAFTGTFGIALIVLSRNLDPSPVTLGLLLGACGIGGVLGSLAAGPTGRRRRHR